MMSPVEFFSAGLCHKIANPWDPKNELFDVFNVHLFFFKFDKSCYFDIKKQDMIISVWLFLTK